MAQRKTRSRGKSPQAAAQETYEELNKLKVVDLRKQATAAGIKPGKSNKATLVRLICASKRIPHPEDERYDSIPPLPPLSPSPTILSAQRKAALKANATAATNAPEAIPSDAPVGPLPEYPASRANPLDTRRVPPAPLDTEAPPAHYTNLPPLENTPEPQAPLPADRRTLQQTVAMLAALKRQNAELAEQVQKINEVARKVKGEASTLRTALHVEKTRRERAQVYILNHRSEAPTLSLDDVFLPDRDVLAIQDEETGELVEEVDAMVQDTPRFAMILEAEKNRTTFQDFYVANARNGDVDDDDDDMEDDGAAEADSQEESFVADLLDPASREEEKPNKDDKDSRHADIGPATRPPAPAGRNADPFAYPPPPTGRGLKRTASFREDSRNDDENPFNPKRPRANEPPPHPSDAVRRVPVHHETPKRKHKAPSVLKTRPAPKPPLPKGTAMSFNLVDGKLHTKNRPSTLGLAPPGPKPEPEAAPAADASLAEAESTSSPFNAPMRTLRGLVGRLYSGATAANPPDSSQAQDNLIGDTSAARAAVAAARHLQRQDAFIHRRGDSTGELPLQSEDSVSGIGPLYSGATAATPPDRPQPQGTLIGATNAAPAAVPAARPLQRQNAFYKYRDSTVELPLRSEVSVFGNAGARSAMGPPSALHQSTVFGNPAGRSDTDTYTSIFGSRPSTNSDINARTATANARSLQREGSTDSNISDRTVIGTTRPPMQRQDSMISWLSDRTVTGTTRPSMQRQASVASSGGAWSSTATIGRGASSSLQREDSVASSSGWSTATTAGHGASSTLQRQASVASSSSAWSHAATTGRGASSSNFQRLDSVYEGTAARSDADIIANSTLLRQDSPAASGTSTRTVRQGYAPSRPPPGRAVEAPRIDIPIAAGFNQDSDANHTADAWAVGPRRAPPLRRHETEALLDLAPSEPRRSGRQHGSTLYLNR